MLSANHSPQRQVIEAFLRANHYIQEGQNFNDFLRQQKMIDEDESADDMYLRVCKILAQAGATFYGEENVSTYQNEFYQLVTEGKIVLSTPIYTNAGRHLTKPMSACAVPTYNFKQINFKQLQDLIASYHSKGMGTGFNLDEASDPLSTLKILNRFAIDEVEQKLIERPVGNMAILSITHPQALVFAQAKMDKSVPQWKFNLSININSDFVEAIEQNRPYSFKDGCLQDPKQFLVSLCEFAVKTGCPGVVFMEQHEACNKVPHLGQYRSVAPCGEIPLLDGEICQFASLNLLAFVNNDEINYPSLKKAIVLAITLLDNALELSLARLPDEEKQSISAKIRKIGLGVCGFSDLLMHLGLPYNSPEALILAEALINFINLESKKASINLAGGRKAFPAYHDEQTRRDLILGPYLQRTRASSTESEWERAHQVMQQYGIRNASTVILPPTGRSAMMAGVNASIEPPFRLALDLQTQNSIQKHCAKAGCSHLVPEAFEAIKSKGSLAGTSLPSKIKAIFATCVELTPHDHLKMVACFQRFTDESISKTVNLPKGSNAETVANIYLEAFKKGLKGITVYVDGSYEAQPKAISKTQGKGRERWKKALSQLRPLVSTAQGRGMLIENSRLERDPHLIKYQLEYLDPLHRDPAYLYQHFSLWKISSSSNNFFTWLEQEEKNDQQTQKLVSYFKNPEPYALSFDAEGLACQNGKHYDSSDCGGKEPGFALFVISPQTKKMYVLPYILSKQHHSSLLAGNRVLCPGLVQIKEGRFTALSLVSGHYSPGPKELEALFSFLKSNQVNIDNFSFIREYGNFANKEDRYPQFPEKLVEDCVAKVGLGKIVMVDKHPNYDAQQRREFNRIN